MNKKLLLMLVSSFLFFSTLTAQTLSGDPWIFKIYKEVYNRQPNALEINMKNYNSGSWNNYDELKKYIQEFQTALKQSAIVISTVYLNDVAIIGIRQGGQQIAVAALSLNGGKVLAKDGASIINGDAGNILSNGGGIITAQDGSGIAVNSKMGGIAFESSGISTSEINRVIRSGKGALVISKKQ